MRGLKKEKETKQNQAITKKKVPRTGTFLLLGGHPGSTPAFQPTEATVGRY